MTKRQGKSGTIDVKAILAEDEEFLRALVRTALQEVLEAEMTEALSAEKGERAAGRQGYRSGYYGRTLSRGSANWKLRVPQDRAGRFSTELFERYQRSERALVAALAEMYVPPTAGGSSPGSVAPCSAVKLKRVLAISSAAMRARAIKGRLSTLRGGMSTK